MRTLTLAIDETSLWEGSKIGAIVIERCEACGGAWFDEGEWRDYLSKRLAGLPPAPELKSERRELFDHRIADCPRCGIFLEKRRLNGRNADICPSCRGTWLDGDEFPTDNRRSWEQWLRDIVRK